MQLEFILWSVMSNASVIYDIYFWLANQFYNFGSWLMLVIQLLLLLCFFSLSFKYVELHKSEALSILH